MNADEQFTLVEVDEQALLLDLRSGELFQLNASATLVWREHLNGATAEQASQRLANRYGISLPQARADTHAVLRGGLPSVSPVEETEFRYEQQPQGYLFSRAGRPLFVVSDSGEQVALAEGASLTTAEAQGLLASVAPKILALRGATVLHASAVACARGVVVLLGASGAGKTTTAQALARAGASLISADKLVIEVSDRGDRVFAAGGTERIIAQWVTSVLPDLLQGQAVSCAELASIHQEPALPVAEVGWLSVDGRSSGPYRADRLNTREAAGTFFANSFYGSAVPARWKRHLEQSVAMARRISLYRLRMPDTLVALGTCAERIFARGSLRL